MNTIKCPCCGAEIEIEARQVQAELALGPIEVHARHSAKIKLDGKSPGLSKIEPARIESGHESEPPTRRESNRIELGIESSIASDEEAESLIESLRGIVVQREWNLNGRLWRWRVKHKRRATLHAIEDWKLQSPQQQHDINNRGAWLTDRFQRA